MFTKPNPDALESVQHLFSTLAHYLITIHFNIILPLVLKYRKWHLPFTFPDYDSYAFLISLLLSPSHPPSSVIW
jgi:hypothetical protein